MLILLSPAKTLDESPYTENSTTTPRLLDKSEKLVKILKKKSVGDLQELMSISEKLAVENVARYKNYATPFTNENTKPAAFLFKGDVYTGLEASNFTKSEMEFAQKHIRILSGLYGLLRPMDLTFPYRLEMGTKLKVGKNKNLYEFWGNAITDVLNEDLAASGTNLVLNLASKEYFKSINKKEVNGQIIDIDFKELRNGKYKVISFNAKKARGQMARIITKERILDIAALKEIVVGDYVFNQELSTESHLIYTID